MYCNKSKIGVINLTLCLFIGSLFPIPSMAGTAPREESLVIGVISSNPKKAFKRTQPIADYLATNLQQHQITNAQVVVAKDTRQMALWLRNGQVDLVSETVFSAQELIEEAGAEILARRWKSGVAEYNSIFFSKLNNGVDSLDDLRGKTVVFEDRGSTSAFLIPVSILLEQGYELYELTSPRDTPPNGKIGYFFSDDFSKSGGESNMISWVHRKFVAAAAFSNLDWNNEITEQVQHDLQIIHSSQFVPRSLILARPTLSSEVKQAILEILLTAHQDQQGKNALIAYQKTKKFDAIKPDIEQSFQWAKEQKKLVDEYFDR